LRMEMRRQVTVSWDPDEAPPKVRINDCLCSICLFEIICFPSSHVLVISFGGSYPSTDSWNPHRPEHTAPWRPFSSLSLFLQDIGCVGQALMEERLMMQQQQMEDDQRWLEQEESFMKAESRNSRGSVDREDGTLQAPVSLCVRVCVCFDILKLDSLVVLLSCGAWLDKCLWC
uniref:Uncharacterized protein n=1 Tax=Neolamprologus brichardi TaxID=32507 RepID=A0A3Q4MT55_NEOBR